MMTKHRIVEIETFDEIWYQVERKVLGIFWRRYSSMGTRDYDGFVSCFSTRVEAEKFIAAKEFGTRKRVLP